MKKTLCSTKILMETTDESASNLSNSSMRFPMRCFNVGEKFPMLQRDTTKLKCKYCYLMSGEIQRQVKKYCDKCEVPLCLNKDRKFFRQ